MRKRTTRWGAVVVSALVLVAAMAGCGGDAENPTAPRREAGTTGGDLDLGERVFARNCASCHGRDGGGGVGPKLADGRVVERYADPSDHRAIVVNGRGAMPPWGDKLSDQEIDAVVRYEREGL